MKKKLTDTEKANIELDNIFYGEGEEQNMDKLINNNNISLVLNNNEENDKDNEDMG